MLELLNFSQEQIQVFILVLARIGIVLYMFPIFGAQVVPGPVKAALCLVLALLLAPVIVLNPGAVFPQNSVQLLAFIFSEAMIGLALGLCLRIFFAGVQLAGTMIGFQMGFAMINIVDPQSGDQVSIMEQIGYWVVLLIFLLLNGHLALIAGIVESFRIIGTGYAGVTGGLVSQLVSLTSEMFVLAVKIGSPAIAALFLTDIAFGLCAKFEPRMNILIASFPIKIAVGLIFFGLTLQVVLIFARAYTSRFADLIHRILLLMEGA